MAEAAGDASLIKSSNPHLAGGEKMEEGLQVLEHSYAGRARLVEPVDVTREARKLNEFKFNVRQMKSAMSKNCCNLPFKCSILSDQVF